MLWAEDSFLFFFFFPLPSAVPFSCCVCEDGLPCPNFDHCPSSIFSLFPGFCHLPKDNHRAHLSTVITYCHYYINMPSDVSQIDVNMPSSGLPFSDWSFSLKPNVPLLSVISRTSLPQFTLGVWGQ